MTFGFGDPWSMTFGLAAGVGLADGLGLAEALGFVEAEADGSGVGDADASGAAEGWALSVAAPRAGVAAAGEPASFGESGSTRVTDAPGFPPSFGSSVVPSNPHQDEASSPLFTSSRATRSARSIGMAKPIPWPVASTAEQTPITFPSALISGPPELPGLIYASVWMKS